jgi:hypothetical protein
VNCPKHTLSVPASCAERWVRPVFELWRSEFVLNSGQVWTSPSLSPGLRNSTCWKSYPCNDRDFLNRIPYPCYETLAFASLSKFYLPLNSSVIWYLILYTCKHNTYVWPYCCRGADKSLARPSSRCRKTESIVSLERGVCSCAELQVFSCYRGWKEACQATREFGRCSLFPSWSV